MKRWRGGGFPYDDGGAMHRSRRTRPMTTGKFSRRLVSE